MDPHGHRVGVLGGGVGGHPAGGDACEHQAHHEGADQNQQAIRELGAGGVETGISGSWPLLRAPVAVDHGQAQRHTKDGGEKRHDRVTKEEGQNRRKEQVNRGRDAHS